jgi:hypothetical protein
VGNKTLLKKILGQRSLGQGSFFVAYGSAFYKVKRGKPMPVWRINGTVESTFMGRQASPSHAALYSGQRHAAMKQTLNR